MASDRELRDKHRQHLGVLLKLKRLNAGRECVGLQEAINEALIPLDNDDIAWVEKLTGCTAE